MNKASLIHFVILRYRLYFLDVRWFRHVTGSRPAIAPDIEDHQFGDLF